MCQQDHKPSCLQPLFIAVVIIQNKHVSDVTSDLFVHELIADVDHTCNSKVSNWHCDDAVEVLPPQKPRHSCCSL